MNATSERLSIASLILRLQKSEPTSHYEVLGICGSVFKLQDVEGAYRLRVNEVKQATVRPDPNLAKALLRALSIAKVVLSDPRQRLQYDEELKRRTASATPPPLTSGPSITLQPLVAAQAPAKPTRSINPIVYWIALGCACLVVVAVVGVIMAARGGRPALHAQAKSAASGSLIPLPPPPPAVPSVQPSSSAANPAPTGEAAPDTPIETPNEVEKTRELSPSPPASEADTEPELTPVLDVPRPAPAADSFGSDIGDAAPSIVRLPEWTSEGAALTPLSAFFDSTTTIALDTSAAMLPAGQALALAAPTSEQDAWLLRLEPSAAPGTSSYVDLLTGKSISIATFRVKDNSLVTTWTSTAPPAIQRQLQNCVLTLTAGDQRQTLIFRNAEISSALTLSLSKAPQKLELQVLDQPSKERLRFELLQVDGFDADFTRIPATGILPANERFRLLPQLTLASEFQLELAPSRESLAIYVRPYITLVEGQRQEFSLERLTSIMTTTQGKLRRDSERLAFLVNRLKVIPGIMEDLASARLPEAQRRANLATLRDEFQAANNGVARLRRTLPLTKEAVERLQAAEKLANTLDGAVELRMRVYAQADTAEIPLWTIGE